MDRYDVFVKRPDDLDGWSMTIQADDYAHAEEQATPYLSANDYIVRIEKELVK